MRKGVTVDGPLQRRLQLRLVAFVSQPGKVSAFHLFMFSLDQQRWWLPRPWAFIPFVLR